MNQPHRAAASAFLPWFIAYGEVVVVEESFGIKITELVGSKPPAS